jgi:hypothetical protein
MESDSSWRRFRDVLYEALAGDETAVRDEAPLQTLARLTENGMTKAEAEPGSLVALSNLNAVAREGHLETAISIAEARFESPEAFGDAIYFARCLNRDVSGSLTLNGARRYVEEARVPPSFSELRTDQAAVLDATTFEALWREPQRLEWMEATLGIWRREYATAYLPQHTAHQAALTMVAVRIDALVGAAAALERLNGLTRLGPPLGAAALSQFHELERLFACPQEVHQLAEELENICVCSICGYRLGDPSPTADARRVNQAIERALSGQQARLGRRVVSRLLRRPMESGDEQLARFIQVVQASDLSGLTLVLDDSLVDFLRTLLESAPPETGLLDRLGKSFPVVTPANLDAVIAEFRSLLQADLARNDGSLHLDHET